MMLHNGSIDSVLVMNLHDQRFRNMKFHAPQIIREPRKSVVSNNQNDSNNSDKQSLTNDELDEDCLRNETE